jgi:hypothetical protein
MINKIKHKAYLLGLLLSMNCVVAMAQERSVGDIVTFDFDKCPVLTHEVMPNAVTPHLNNKARTTIGVGEKVKIISSKEVVNWEIVSPLPCSGLIIEKGKKECTYEASIDPCNEVIIRANFSGSCPPQDKKFKVIAPTEIIFEKTCGYHTKNEFDVGLITHQVSLLPDNVSFAYLSIKELEAYARGTGVLTSATGQPHGASGTWINCILYPSLGISNVEAGKGTLIDFKSIDDAAMEINFGPKIPLSPIGTITFVIPWVYAKSSDTSNERQIQRVLQQGILNINSLDMRKSNQVHSAIVTDPGNGRIDCK